MAEGGEFAMQERLHEGGWHRLIFHVDGQRVSQLSSFLAFLAPPAMYTVHCTVRGACIPFYIYRIFFMKNLFIVAQLFDLTNYVLFSKAGFG